VLFALGLILLLVFVYLRRRRLNRQLAQQNPISATESVSTPARASRRRERVWRSEVIVGLPGYTKEPRQGELSLGAGKKFSSEYELNAMETGNLERVETGELQVAQGGTSNMGESTQETTPSDPSPPYLPPPERAVLSRSRQNQSYPEEMYITALGPGGRRVRF
jgi:hypothetical protein